MPAVTDHYIALARQAVEEWDGVDTADLVAAIYEKTGEHNPLERQIREIREYQGMRVATPHGFRCRLCRSWWAWDADEQHDPHCPLNLTSPHAP